MKKSDRSVRQELSTFTRDLDLLIKIHEHTPELRREVYKMPSKVMVNSFKRWIDKQFLRIEKKEAEIKGLSILMIKH